MKRQQFTGYFANAALWLFIAMMLLAVPLLRAEESSYIGREAYFLTRIADNVPGYDHLSYSGRIAGYNPGTPYLMGLFPEQCWRFLPFALAYLSIIVFWLLIQKFGITGKWALLLLASSPAFLFIASTPNRFVVPLFLLLLSFLFIYSDKKFLRAIGVPIAALLPLFDFVFAAIVLAIMVIFALFGKRSRKYFWVAAIALAFATLSFFLFLFYRAGWPGLFNPENHFFGINYALRAIISDFGGFAGISLFALILFVLGLISVWQTKYSRIEIFLSVSLLLVLSFFRIEAIILLALLVAVFAAIGLRHLLSSNWENSTLKLLVLIIVACGIIFSGVAHAKELVNSEPNYGVMNAIEFLEKKKDGIVFSDYSRGNWISFAGKRNVLDQNFLFAPQAMERFIDSRTLLYTRDYDMALSLFKKYNIKYIWMDQDLKEKLYSDKEEGLLFLMQYSSNITNIYNQDGVQVWEIEG